MTEDQIRNDIAEAIGADPAELKGDQSLIDQGLDSLRMINVIEQWRADGHEVDFFTLSSTPTLDGWIKELTA